MGDLEGTAGTRVRYLVPVGCLAMAAAWGRGAWWLGPAITGVGLVALGVYVLLTRRRRAVGVEDVDQGASLGEGGAPTGR